MLTKISFTQVIVNLVGKSYISFVFIHRNTGSRKKSSSLKLITKIALFFGKYFNNPDKIPTDSVNVISPYFGKSKVK